MLTRLNRIIQEVNAQETFNQALQVLVKNVAEAINAESCSVFLADSRKKLFFLAAAVGYNENAVGRVKLKFDEGIIGLIAARGEPINVSDATIHPQYCYLPETGEEIYKACLGVPIIHQRRLVGVIIVQQKKKRRYDESEEAFLVTLSAQLASIIALAESTGEMPEFKYKEYSRGEATLQGVPSAPGVSIGIAKVIYAPEYLESVPDKYIESPSEEIDFFKTAIYAAKQEIKSLSSKMRGILPEEELSLFDAYFKILESDTLCNEVIVEIEKGIWAQGALSKVIIKHIKLFESMEDKYLRERASDLKDLGRRVLRHLQTTYKSEVDYPVKTVLVGEEITPAALAEVPQGYLKAILSQKGSTNSHVAILARAMGIPAVMGAESLPLNKLDTQQIIVDGYNGEVFIDPPKRLIKEYMRLEKEEQELSDGLTELRKLRAQTPDGKRISLCVNAGLVADIKPSLAAGAEGIGLYRTEIPFMIRDRFPGEDEQRAIYRQLLESFFPKPVTIRTLDIGGDKSLPYFYVKEDNPFLGWRGIRVTLDHPEIFLAQIRAMLKANHGLNNLRVLLPMISGVQEIDDALRLIKQAHTELIEEGHEIVRPPVGAMIEVPSSVYQARPIARRVDFLSVGSNDLTQYLLAVDRNNARVASLYDSFHPAVLHSLDRVVKDAHSESKIISICGEMACDPRAVIILMAMGFDTLSMNAKSLSSAKWVVRNFTMAKAKNILQRILQMENPEEIKSHLEFALESHGLGGLVRAGK